MTAAPRIRGSSVAQFLGLVQDGPHDSHRPQRRIGKHVYSTKAERGVSWYQDQPRLSLELIGAVAPANGGRIIDVGGGASVLVDRLLDRPFERIAVLDISETALGKAKARLGERDERVLWMVADVTESP